MVASLVVPPPPNNGFYFFGQAWMNKVFLLWNDGDGKWSRNWTDVWWLNWKKVKVGNLDIIDLKETLYRKESYYFIKDAFLRELFSIYTL